MAGDDILERIRAKREQRRLLSEELSALVREAMDERGYTWQEVGGVLGVGRARVYQIRNAKQ